jgi:TRAP-type C4-dicarboxylate transport system permease small subunit
MPMTLVERIHAAERRMTDVEKVLLTVLIVAMATITCLQVILRSVFSAGILWADVFSRHLVLWVGFLGAGVAAAQNKHFATDAIDRVFSERVQSFTHLAIHLFTATVCGFLTKAAIVFIADEFEASKVLFSVGGLHVPAAIYEIILPGGFLLLMSHYLLKSLAVVLEMRK